MEISDLITEDAVLLLDHVDSKDALLQAMSRHAAELRGLDPDVVLAGIVERESLGSTGLGGGIAIPHGKFGGLAGVTAVFARLRQPIDFQAVDDAKVDLVVMLLAPMGAGADHLKALALVARLLRTEERVEALRRAPDARRTHEILVGQPAAYAA